MNDSCLSLWQSKLEWITVTPHLLLSQCSTLGEALLLNEGMYSSVDLKPRTLSLWNLVLCLGLLLMHSPPLCPWGGTTKPLCSVWTKWAPQKRDCQIVMHVSLHQRDRGCLAALHGGITTWRAERQASVVMIAQQPFYHILQGFAVGIQILLFRKWGAATRKRWSHEAIYTTPYPTATSQDREHTVSQFFCPGCVYCGATGWLTY